MASHDADPSPDRRAPAFVFGTALIPAVVLIGVGLLWDRPTPSWDSRHLLLRIGAALALGCAAWWVTHKAWALFKKWLLTDWWDPASQPDGELTWDMVLRLTAGPDPLAVAPTRRPGRPLVAVTLLWLATAILSCAMMVAVHFILFPHVPEVLVKSSAGPVKPGDAANLSGNLTALLALIAASVSIVFTYHQLRAKVRADNRQAWIARLRALTAEVTALSFELGEAGTNATRTAEIWKKLGARRFEFELMLNPRERDHRLLIYLVQRLGSPGRPIQDYIKDAEDLRTNIQNGEASLPAGWRRILDCNQRDELTGYIMRLSHIVLKREWERVKRTR